MVLPPLVIPGAYLVALTGSVNGKTVENVIGITNPGTPVATTQSICNDVGNAWSSATGPVKWAAGAYTFTGIKVTDLSSATGPVSTKSYSVVGGQGSGNMATMASCALITWHGGTRNRSANGRMYFGPLMTANVNTDGRTLNSTYLGNLNTAFTNFNTAIGFAGLEWVTLSRKHLTYAQVPNPSGEATIATQRRRHR